VTRGEERGWFFDWKAAQPAAEVARSSESDSFAIVRIMDSG